MNYKLIGSDLVSQKAKGCQWYKVSEDELNRLALLWVEHERLLTKRAVDGACTCALPVVPFDHNGYCQRCGLPLPPPRK